MKTNSYLSRWAITAFVALFAWLPAQAQENGPVNAVSLDGATGYLSLPSGVWFSNNFTVEGWVYVRSYNSWSRLIDFADGPNNYNVYVALTSGTGGYPAMGCFLANNGSPVLTATNQLPLNQWAHLAATLNGTTGTIYINGAVAGSATLNVPPNVVRNTNYIGRSAYSADSYANAEFDDIRIWNVARTQAQIQSYMHRSLVGNETGLIGYWRFDEATGTSTVDGSGHGQTATQFGGVTRVASTAPVAAAGEGLSFNGNCQIVSVPSQASLNAFPLTVMAWFMDPVTNTGGGGALVNKYESGTGNGYQIALGSQLHAWYYRNASNMVSNLGAGPVNDGLWHQTALVVDTNGGRLYLDGVLASSLPWAGTAGPGACTTTEPLEFGVYPGDSCWTGQLDEVSIWNTALTTNQMQTYMHQSLVGTETGLVAYYRLDEGTGTTTADATGNGNTGTLASGSGAPTWVLSGAELGAPQVITLAATVSGNSATLTNSVNPQGQTNGAWFQWGTTTNYGSNTAVVSSGASFTVVTNSAVLSNLSLTTYHYRAVATNTGDTNFGLDMSFTISGTPPTITNVSVTNITGNSAVASASVNPQNTATTVYFAYGLTTNYGATNSAGSIGSGPVPVLVSNTFSGLSQNSLYHYIVIASNIAGVATGTPLTFQTLSPPVLTTLAVSNISLTSATLNASVNPEGSGTFVYFAYGTTTNYGTTNILSNVGNGTTAVIVSNNLSNLSIGTTYHYLVTASNAAGEVSGTASTFTTLALFASAGTGLTPPVDFSAPVAWADYNNDGFLDLVMEQTLWSNQDNGTFSPSSLSSARLGYGCVAWGDVDNDGNLDLLISAQSVTTYSPVTQLWHNNGNGTFTLLNNTGLPNLQNGMAVFGDFENDGRQDILMFGFLTSGNNGNILSGGLWHNNGNDTFTQLSVPGLPALWYGSVATGDFDNDGYLDFIVSGYDSGYNYHTELWRNNGNGTFTQMPAAGLPQLGNSAVAVGDYNNDGNLDLLLTGQASTGTVSQVWSNNGNWSFTQDTQVTLPGSVGCAAWGDFDNDGNLDLMIAGSTATSSSTGEPISPIAQVWRNQGNGTFANLNLNLPAYLYNSATVADYNNDGRLDLLLEGLAGNTIDVTLEKNQTPVTNTPPSAPFGLQALPNGTTVLLSWDAASDAQTPAAGLSYNIRVGSTPGGVDIVSPASNPANGARRLPQIGNSQERLFAILANLPAGTYYWSVQAIDTTFAGSVFAPEAQFTITNVPPGELVVTLLADSISNEGATLNGTVNPDGQAATAWFEWGSTTNYGNATIAENEGSGAVSVAFNASLNGLNAAATYHFRAVATSAGGTNYGQDVSFTTGLPFAPQVTDSAFGNVTSTSASVNATVNPEGAPTAVYAAYGLSTNYSETNFIGNTGVANLPVAVSNTLSGLSASTLYHFLIFASNSGGMGVGTDTTFTTDPLAPTLLRFAVTNITVTNATLTAAVNPDGGATTVYFAYGTTTNLGLTNSSGVIGSGTTNVNVTNTLTGLTGGALYYFQVIVSNLGNTVSGMTSNFTTEPGPPVLSSVSALGVTSTSATLSAAVDPSGADTTVYFLYGLNASYGTTNSVDSGSGANVVTVPNSISNLSASTLYHFLVIASNINGVVSGVDSTFTTHAIFETANASLPSPDDLYVGAAWGDFNNDGFLDIGMNDQLFSNNGNGTFTGEGIGAANGYNSTVAWGDFENDGFLDYLVVSEQPEAVQLWHNNGSGAFTQIANTGLPFTAEYPGVAAVAIGDFNNDGKLDMLFAGGYRSGIWTNSGNGTFAQLPIPELPGLQNVSVACGDFNNDGYLDFIVSGDAPGNNLYAAMWRNNGDGTFSPVSIPGLTDYSEGNIAVGDFNNDGRLDFLTMGMDPYGNVNCQVWTNGGNFVFAQDTSAGLPGEYYGNVTLGDFDNDGNLDVALMGSGNNGYGQGLGSPITQVWRNLGNGSFGNINANLPNLYEGTVTWGDFNNDGRLDLLLEGLPYISSPSEVDLLQNFTAVTNTPPTAPAGLQASVQGTGVVLSWNAASDAQTPAAGLSYNIRVGSASGGVNIVSPQADPVTGFRRVPQWGNAQENLMAILTNLSAGTYYWSVQAIDTAFAGSPFAPESQFTITGPVAVTGTTGQITSGSAVLNGTVTPNGNNTTAWFQWDTSTNYGSNTISVVVSGTNSGPVTVSLLASCLSPVTQYYYRLAASNAIGLSYGAGSNFTTIATVPPQINDILAQSSNTFLLQFNGESGLGYTLQDSTNLINWRTVTNLTAGTNGLFQYIGNDPTNIPAFYFRLRRP